MEIRSQGEAPVAMRLPLYLTDSLPGGVIFYNGERIYALLAVNVLN